MKKGGRKCQPPLRRTSFPTRSGWESELENSLYVSRSPPTAPTTPRACSRAQVRDREHQLARPGLSRGGPGRAQHLRGGGHKRRVVGHGRLQANGLRDGLRAVFFGFTTGGYWARGICVKKRDWIVGEQAG